MATVTPNFNWPVPTSTDLVKDGATAIEALGDSIDASLVDLKGGTSGQVLSKNSNTDMDFVWVTTDDANAIQNAIVNAKGDIIGASANDVPAITSVGANGDGLVADSSTSTGLRWQEPFTLNPVINSGFDIWQRGTTSTALGSGTFLADRWQAARTGFAAGASQSRQVTGDTTNLPNIEYCLRIQRDVTNTSTLAIIMGQNVESVNSIPYAGKTVTLSFYARAGSQFSAASSILSTFFASGTGTDQNLITAGTLTGINNTSTNHTLSTTWQRFTVTKAIDSTATQLAFQFFYSPVGTALANDYFEVTGVMINIGSVATPFRRTSGTIATELTICQRYFAKSYSQATAPATNSSANGLVFAQSGATVAASAYFANVPLPVTMRTNPTVTIYSFTSSQTARVSDGAGTDLAASSGATNLINDARFTVQNNSGGALTAATGGFVFHYTVSAEI
jgi:hypothetical protein